MYSGITLDEPPPPRQASSTNLDWPMIDDGPGVGIEGQHAAVVLEQDGDLRADGSGDSAVGLCVDLAGFVRALELSEPEHLGVAADQGTVDGLDLEAGVLEGGLDSSSR